MMNPHFTPLSLRSKKLRWSALPQLVLCVAALVSSACTSDGDSGDDSGPGGTTGQDDSGRGGENNSGSGGSSSGSGGSGTKEERCATPGALLGYWWSQGEEIGGEGTYRLGEAIVGKHASIVAPAGYGIQSSLVGSALVFTSRVSAFANSPVADASAEPWPLATIEFWLLSYASSAPLLSWGDALQLSQREGGLHLSYTWTSEDESSSATFDETSTQSLSSTPSPLPPARSDYHHVAIVTDAEALEARLYLDGELELSLDFDEQLGGDLSKAQKIERVESILARAGRSSLQLGGQGVESRAWFSGTLDELSLYGAPLSAAQIQEIADAGSLGKCETEE